MSSNITGSDVGVTKFGQPDNHPSETIRTAIRTWFWVIAVGWIFFEVARQRWLANAYYCRERSVETTGPSVEQSRRTRFLGWVWRLYKTNDDLVLDQCGLDTLFYMRFMRMLTKLSVMGVLMSAVLFPVYYHGVNHLQKEFDTDDVIFRFSMSNIDKDDAKWRFIFPVAALYVISFLTYYFLYQENVEYVKRRHQFLGRKHTQQYSIVINDLPMHLRTPKTLREYMQSMFPGTVLYVYVALECGDLEKLLSARTKVRDQLEHFLALSAQTGEPVIKRKSMCCGDKVDKIAELQEQLQDLNDAVLAEANRILRKQQKLTDHVMEKAAEASDQKFAIDTDFLDLESDTAAEEQQKEDNAFIRGLKMNAKVFSRGGIMRSTGFVTFNSIKAAQSAQQILQSGRPTEMMVEPAPFVEEIVWENVGISYDQKSTWQLISYVATAGIILLWVFPTMIVVSFSTVSQLKQKYKWLADFIDDHPWSESVLEQLAPIMLSVMNALAPIIMGMLSKQEGHCSESLVNGSMFAKVVCHQVVVTFLFPLIGGTAFASLDTLTSSLSASKIFEELGSQLPGQSTFFVSYIVVLMSVNLTLEFLRVIPLIKAFIYNRFAPKLTPRERESPWFGLGPIDLPGSFDQADSLAQYYLVLILVLVFCPIAPIVCYFAAGYSFLSELVYRWHALCVYDPSPQSIGVYFPALYRFCIGALFLTQVVMISLLGIKVVPVAATCTIPLVVITYLFHLFIDTRFPRTAKNLPLEECIAIDSRRAEKPGEIEDVLEDVYKQPAMADRDPIAPDYQIFASEATPETMLATPVEEALGAPSSQRALH